MPDKALTNSAIIANYRERTPGSAALAKEAKSVLPSGIAHDARYLDPYGIYVARAATSRKWDVDDNAYIDYFGGHGSLILGHGHPKVLAAVHAALDRGTHFGCSHAAEVDWAKAVQRLIPSAQRLRFTSSGTEATLLCLRLARAHTGRRKVLRFLTHFHGWHDQMTSGFMSHFDGSPTAGVLKSVAENAVLIPPHDIDAVAQTLASDNDIAAIILEPTGASFGRIPIAAEALSRLRELTEKHGVVLIFDEVITGFRVSPGGAQAHYGVTPDLTSLAKILAGGLPGGAVAGRKEILDHLDFEVAANEKREKIAHPGTYNGNPISAAAGIATLEIIATTDACDRANICAASLRQRLNTLFSELAAPMAVYGSFSAFHIFTNPKRREIHHDSFDPRQIPWQELKESNPRLVHRLRLALLNEGVDIASWPGGLTSSVHSEADLDMTVEAFRAALISLRREGEL
ncbi:MAG: aspartate aminotransferase family protein [Alphaproteobacteria bacterium]